MHPFSFFFFLFDILAYISFVVIPLAFRHVFNSGSVFDHYLGIAFGYINICVHIQQIKALFFWLSYHYTQLQLQPDLPF